MWQNLHDANQLVTFTEEIRHEKLHFLCSLSLDTKEWKCRENSRKIHIKDIKNTNLHGPGKY